MKLIKILVLILLAQTAFCTEPQKNTKNSLFNTHHFKVGRQFQSINQTTPYSYFFGPQVPKPLRDIPLHMKD